FIEAGIMAEYSDARSRGGGRTFRRTTPQKKAPAQQQKQTTQGTKQKSGFGRGLAGGLLGGALGGMLFGSLFGMGGSGMGILPLLLLGVVGYFFYKRFAASRTGGAPPGYQPPPQDRGFGTSQSGAGTGFSQPPPSPEPQVSSLDEGIGLIRIADPDFDPAYFVEVASDVFFKVQAGWMRRDIDSYRHLLGEQLAAEYVGHFDEMKAKGEINKLESISIRKVELVAAGSENGEDFATVLFTANLLDYTVDDTSGDLISGSMTEPVKFAEEWTWARPIGTQEWKLEGLKEV
ncbi:MAG: Tim44 domain-containing protein, partial [Thermodesulfobacteriota bacterium]